MLFIITITGLSRYPAPPSRPSCEKELGNVHFISQEGFRDGTDGAPALTMAIFQLLAPTPSDDGDGRELR